MRDTLCPICNKSSKIIDNNKNPFDKIIDCEKCGKYFISDTILDKIQLPEILEKDKDKISSWISEQCKIFNNQLPKLTQNNFDSILNHRDKIIKEKFDCFMKTLLNNTNNKGISHLKKLFYINHCYMQEKDLQIFINKAKKNNYISDIFFDSYTLDCIFTFEGLEYIESLQQTNINSKNIFCAFHFTSELQSMFDSQIKNTIESLNYKYSRVSSSSTSTDKKIDDEIISLIRSARIVIADFTGQRNSVYFEAGLAMGLNIPVIWTCREDEIDELSFDTRQYPHIVWKNEEDLAKKIELRIKAMP